MLLVERVDGAVHQVRLAAQLRRAPSEATESIASTSPPRIAWISELVSVMILKSTSASFGFAPYHVGFAFSVTP